MNYCFSNPIPLHKKFLCSYLLKGDGGFIKRSILRLFFLIGFFLTGYLSLYADNSDEEQIIYAWQLDELLTEKKSVEIDTMINAFHVHNPVFRHSISSSFLGNAGLASMSNIFNERVLYSDFYFIDHFRSYLHNSLENKYYNTKRPFSLIDFSTGGPRGKNEKMLNILHTQNVNPDFNLGFRYFNINSDGQYQNQQAITNAVSLFSSYELDNYELHANLNLNSVRVFENGGLVDDESLYNEDFETEDHTVRLQDVRNGISNNSFFMSQSWQPFLYSGNDTLPETGASWLSGFKLFHVLNYNQYKRTYQDNNPQSGFYEQILIDNNRTFDSVYYRSLTNKVMTELPGFDRGSIRFNARAGIKNELLKGSYNIKNDTVFIFDRPPSTNSLLPEPVDTLVTKRNESKYQSNAVIATARGTAGEIFNIWGEGEYFFQGHRSGEYDLQAGLSFDFFEGKNRSIIAAGIIQRETTPSMFLNSFYSNHFSWDNQFRRMGESILKGSISMPQRKLDVSADFNLLNNYIYFDTIAHPRQYNDIIPVLNVSLKKDFQIWRFNFSNQVKYQASGNKEILPLPDLALYQSTWYEQKFIRDIMNVQIGFDIYYTTKYQGYAYQPSTSQFYLQNERMLGNYPFFDIFINIKHKRARVFFKAEHINSGQMPPEYFTVLNYPRNERVLKFGFSWSFYN